MSDFSAALSQPIPRIRTSLGYRIRLLGVLFGLVLLQFLYLLLVAVVVCLAFYVTWVVWSFSPHLNWLTILLYLGPPAIGIIATFFLLKPIIIRRPSPPKPLSLAQGDEPVLFEFIDSLCRTLGAPRPSRIYVDLQVNASAAVRGWRGFFFGNLILTIGLPLASGLTLSQFTGVLAHEFGHFSQRAGLRSYFLIQTIQNWFARVVHQRDGLDAWLDEHCDGGDWRIRVIAGLSRVVVTLSREYLSLLMRAGSWLSSAFSRQMEFNADLHEAAIVGAEVFEQTSQHLPLLAVGSELAWHDAITNWSMKRLPADLSALTVIRAAHLPSESTAAIAVEVLTAETGRWDTHPSTADRIASVRASGFTGVFHSEQPAECLFRSLPDLCCRATEYHYEHMLSIAAGSAKLIATSDLTAEQQTTEAGAEAISKLFGPAADSVPGWFRLAVREPQRHETGEAPLALDDHEYQEITQTDRAHFAAFTIVRSGVKVNPDSFQLKAAGLDSIKEEGAATARKLRDLIETLNSTAQPIAERIETAVARRLSDDTDLLAAWQTYGALSDCRRQIVELQRLLHASQVVRANGQCFGAAPCANLLVTLGRQMTSMINAIIERTAQVQTTIILNPESRSVLGAQLAVAAESDEDRANVFLSRVETIAARSLGRLATAANSAFAVPV